MASNVKPYYAGTQERLDSLRKACPSAKYYPNSNVLFIPDMDAEGGGGDYLLTTEIFATAFGIKYIDSKNDVLQYIPKVTSLVNDKIFGSLSMTVIIDPRTRKNLGLKFDEFLYDLNWGTIGVNVWAAFMAINPYGTWGAPLNRHVDTNIQSGSGKMGNCLLFQNVNKSVIEGNWCDPMVTKLMSAPTPSTSARARAFANLAVHQTFGTLVKLLMTMAGN